MKKFLAIALVLMLAFAAFAGDGKNVLDALSFSNWVGVSYSDASNPQAQTGNSTYMAKGMGNKGFYHLIDAFSASLNKNVFEGNGVKIDVAYDLGVQVRANNDAGAVYFVLDNGFKTNLAFGNIYTMGLGIATTETANVGKAAGIWEYDFTRVKFSMDNSIAIAKIMNISLNVANHLVWESSQAFKTRDLLYLTLGLNGSYDFGFSWSLAEDVTLGFAMQKTADWNPNDRDGSTVLLFDRDHDDWRDIPYFCTKLSIGQDLLKAAGIKAVSLKLSIDEDLLLSLPANNDWNQGSLKLMTQGKYGLNLGVKEYSFGLFMLTSTQDTINPTLGYNQTKANYWSGPRPWGRGQLGFLFNVGFTKDFFSFGFSYMGQGQIRDFDVNQDGFKSMPTGEQRAAGVVNGPLFDPFIVGNYRWLNEFDVTFKINW